MKRTPSDALKTPDQVPRLLTVDEVAQLLGVHRKTVYDLASRGHIGSHQIGRAVRISLEQYQQYLKETRQGSPASVVEVAFEAASAAAGDL